MVHFRAKRSSCESMDPSQSIVVEKDTDVASSFSADSFLIVDPMRIMILNWKSDRQHRISPVGLTLINLIGAIPIVIDLMSEGQKSL